MKTVLMIAGICLALLVGGISMASAQEPYPDSDTPGIQQTPTPPRETPKAEEPKPVVPKKPKGALIGIKAGTVTTQFVSGQGVILKAVVIFDQSVTPFWEELKKADFSPWQLKGMNIGDRQIADKDLGLDYREASFYLSLAADAKYGKHKIPSFSLGYSYFEDKNEIKKKVESPNLEVEKVPLLIGVSSEKDAVTVGEVNVMRFVIYYGPEIKILNEDLKILTQLGRDDEKEVLKRWLKSLEVREQKITDPEKPDLAPFKLLSVKINREEFPSQVKKLTVEYTVAFYDAANKEYFLPSLNIWYLDRSLAAGAQEPREIKTPPISVKVNSVINEKRDTLEGLKGPLSHGEADLHYYGFLPLAGGVFLCLLVTYSFIVDWLGGRKQKVETDNLESSSGALQRVKALLAAGIYNDREACVNLRSALARFAAASAKVPADSALAMTGSEIAQLLEKSSLKEAGIKAQIAKLDRLIYSDVFDKEKANEIGLTVANLISGLKPAKKK